MADEPNEDLSMDDILSSIRNILTEDNAAQQAAAEQEREQPVSELRQEEVEAVYTPVWDEEQPEAAPGLPDAVSDMPEIMSDLPTEAAEISLPEADDEVFELSASMMVDNLPSEEPVELNIADEPEISEADILNFSNLAAEASSELELPSETPFDVVEEAEPEIPVFEPSVPPLPIQAPLASEVLAEEEPEVSLDDVTSLSSLIETAESEALPDEDASAAIPPLDFDLPEIDVDAEPIFEPESVITPEVDPNQVMESLTVAEDVLSEETPEESIIDNATLNEILDFHAQVEETKPVLAEAEEVVAIAEEPDILAEPTDNIQDVLAEPVVEAYTSEADAEDLNAPQDSADVSANIINNFAKLFAEKKAAEAAAMPISELKSETVKPASPSISELVREAVVKQVTQQMDVNFESYAREAVAAQTQAWLDANLPAIVEAVVSKEIERVMAKVGS